MKLHLGGSDAASDGASRKALEVLGPDDLVSVMEDFYAGLVRFESTINRLNVYPVPDGDTGTNMAATVASVLSALSSNDEPGLAPVLEAIARGSLMGARGNSGVILCQVLRGLSEAGRGIEEMRAEELAAGLVGGADSAYGAVQRPVEGTILTVARRAADAGAKARDKGLGAVAEEARRAAVSAVEETPLLLPLLADAGVVDAGGVGLVCLFDALCHVVFGRELPSELELPEGVEKTLESARTNGDKPPAGEQPLDCRYEVMYLLEAEDETIPPFREVWAGLGDSLVVVGGGGLWNCHIHTDDIGGAIEAGVEIGRPRQIRVTDLAGQVEEEAWVKEAAGNDAAEEEDEEETTTAVVAVASGAGIARLLRSLGVRGIVSGGQTKNPSTEELLLAIDDRAANGVIVLPNNPNIVGVAEAAVRLSKRPAAVVATRGIQEGFAALIEFDPASSLEDNKEKMTAAASRVTSGEVTKAVRASSSPVGSVAPGDYIGLSGRGIESVAATAADAACALIERLVEDDHELVALFCGQDAGAGETRHITEWLHRTHPTLEVECHHGGQPLYPYLISIE